MRWLAAIGLSICLLFGTTAWAEEELSSSRPWLGVGIEPAYRGIRIIEVVADTPADIAGMSQGDHLRAINGSPVNSPEELIANISKRKVGEQVEVTLRRQGRVVRLKMELSGVLGEQELLQRRLVGKAAPGFTLPVLHGPPQGQLSELQGKVVIIEFWSPSCVPCNESIELLAGFAAQHPSDVAIVLIAPHQSAASVKQFAAKQGLSMTVLQDRTDSRTLNSYRSTLRPTLVVVDHEGIVRHADVGRQIDFLASVAAADRVLREQRIR